MISGCKRNGEEMADTKLLESIARRLKGSKPEQVRAIIGFDGFVDEVVYLVDKRYDKDRYDRIRYLADYGKKVCDATGLSMNIEMVPVKKKDVYKRQLYEDWKI